MTIEGDTDTEVFRVYVRQVLCPTLRPGDVVIMDNLSPHKSVETLSLIQQLGAEVLFLPAYSPDLNPIEKMWSKLKEFLRSTEARSRPNLIEAIASALETITAQNVGMRLGSGLSGWRIVVRLILIEAIVETLKVTENLPFSSKPQRNSAA